jgi:hypothetical protein
VRLLLPAQHVTFKHVLDPKSGQHMDDFTAVLHIVGDDVGDCATEAFESVRYGQAGVCFGLPYRLQARTERCQIQGAKA